jgi:hypothetical protein
MTDRREFNYTLHLPERKSEADRCSGFDRRQTGRNRSVSFSRYNTRSLMNADSWFRLRHGRTSLQMAW